MSVHLYNVSVTLCSVTVQSSANCFTRDRFPCPRRPQRTHWHSSGSSRQPQRSDYSVGQRPRWRYRSASRIGVWTRLPECVIQSQTICVWTECPGETRKETADSSPPTDTPRKHTSWIVFILPTYLTLIQSWRVLIYRHDLVVDDATLLLVIKVAVFHAGDESIRSTTVGTQSRRQPLRLHGLCKVTELKIWAHIL